MALNVKAKGQGYSLAFGYKERLIDVDLNDYAGKAGVYFVVHTCLARLARLAGLEGYVKDLNGGVCHV